MMWAQRLLTIYYDFYSAFFASLSDSAMNAGRRLSDSSTNDLSESQQIENTLWVNFLVFTLIGVIFELVRGWQRIFTPRRTKRMIRNNRVPPLPQRWPLGWLISVVNISDDEFLEKAGLDAYMFMRYIQVSLRISGIMTLCGFVFLVPVYATALRNEHDNWTKCTIGNVKDSPDAERLWAPVIFSYLFALIFIRSFDQEYQNFLEKRIQYFETGDVDTPIQTNYTIMVESIDTKLRNPFALEQFFEKVLPKEVFSIEMAYDVTELDKACTKRKYIRDKLETLIAQKNCYDERPVEYIWPLCDTRYKKPSNIPSVQDSWLWDCIPYQYYDSIDYYASILTESNEEVITLQSKYFSDLAIVDYSSKKSVVDEREGMGRMEAEIRKGLEALRLPALALEEALNNIKRDLVAGVDNLAETLHVNTMRSPKSKAHSGQIDDGNDSSAHNAHNEDENVLDGTHSPLTQNLLSNDSMISDGKTGGDVSADNASNDHEDKVMSKGAPSSRNNLPVVTRESNGNEVGDGIPQSDKTDDSTTRGCCTPEGQSYLNAFISASLHFIRETCVTTCDGLLALYDGIKSTYKGIEEVTVGSLYYKTSSTAFVTFKSRVAFSMAHQMFLSPEYYSMKFLPAPNPGDIIWQNVHVPIEQVNARKNVAHFGFFWTSLFWSAVVSFITALGNLDELSKRYTWIEDYRNTEGYNLTNTYLAALLLIIVLAILPLIFDLVARNYEGLKLQSEIQESILTRYFYYQCVNVFVSLGLGSILTNLQVFANNPKVIFNILGVSIPSFSVYFATFIIVKALTAVPLEMLRPWPLIQMAIVKLFLNEKACSRRSLTTGIFETPEMLYGWIYPSLLLVLLILSIYGVLAPLVAPFAFIYYFLIYFMYKYQLLYVYVNKYQAGGFMWIAAFKYSMTCLMIGIITLICYMAIRRSFLSGPLYVLLPLPVIVYLYWSNCEKNYKEPALQMSLLSASRMDHTDDDTHDKDDVDVERGEDENLENSPLIKTKSTTVSPSDGMEKDTWVEVLSPPPSRAIDGIKDSEGDADTIWTTFSDKLFRQPSVREAIAKPANSKFIPDDLLVDRLESTVESDPSTMESDDVKIETADRGSNDSQVRSSGYSVNMASPSTDSIDVVDDVEEEEEDERRAEEGSMAGQLQYADRHTEIFLSNGKKWAYIKNIKDLDVGDHDSDSNL